MTATPHDNATMRLAARLALRGRGAVEPNPMVGCVLTAPDGRVIGAGHHRVFGGLHAEVEAIRNAEARGNGTRGATCWVTLEPCAHTGKTPPCADALIDAGVARVIVARRDPNGVASGGVERLLDAGVDVRIRERRDLAWWVSEPFAHTLRTGLPWVVAKWAQTIDGAVATRAGESKWISCEASRRRVHAERGRVDAVLTGIGTVLADDPAFTVRGVPTRRTPIRAVLDPNLDTPMDSQLVRSARDLPVRVYTGAASAASGMSRLADAGVSVVSVPDTPRGLCIESALRDLADAAGASTVMIESGPRVLGSAFEQNVVNEAIVFVAPRIMGDEGANHAVTGLVRERMSEATTLVPWSVRRVGVDAMMRLAVDTGR